MRDLDPPESHFFEAAAGWLGLGLPEEALAELARLTEASRGHPDVLTLEWELLARSGRWPEALTLATRLQETARERPTGWINRSYALHELRRTEEAREALLLALPQFPSVGVIPYNLACYACRLGRLDEARNWLRQAMATEGRETIAARARTDPDLNALHSELDLL